MEPGAAAQPATHTGSGDGRCGFGKRGQAQSSRMMGSLVLAGWAGGPGTSGATTGRMGSAGFTLSGRLGLRAARRISRWVRALRRALQETDSRSEWDSLQAGGQGPSKYPHRQLWV